MKTNLIYSHALYHFMETKMPTKEAVIEIMKTIFDPEINVDVWTLGLIYNIDIADGIVDIRMTFTSVMCPYGPMLVDIITNNVKKLDGVKDVKIDVVFNPPWQPSEELRAMLGV